MQKIKIQQYRIGFTYSPKLEKEVDKMLKRYEKIQKNYEKKKQDCIKKLIERV